MSVEIIEVLRQEWHKCPFEWGLEDCVTVQSEHAGKLILMKIEKFSIDDTSGIRAVPVKKQDMPEYFGS